MMNDVDFMSYESFRDRSIIIGHITFHIPHAGLIQVNSNRFRAFKPHCMNAHLIR